MVTDFYSEVDGSKNFDLPRDPAKIAEDDESQEMVSGLATGNRTDATIAEEMADKYDHKK